MDGKDTPKTVSARGSRLRRFAAGRQRQTAGESGHEYRTLDGKCPGRTLATCPSLAADDLQAEIATRLKAGDTREQIMKDLERKYGTVVLGAPPAEGVGLLLRTVPFLVGLGIVWLLSRLASVRRDAPETVPPTDSRLMAQLDDDLSDLD
jgi:cytochrome c-type biogenesis protein CcmH/NrfF